MADPVPRSRTVGDLLLGALVAVLGLVILGHTLVATTISVLFLGWLLFAGGVVTLAASLLRLGNDGVWAGVFGGGLMTVIGVVFLRHTSAAAVTLTLVAGALFLMSGLVRLVAGFQTAEGRIPLLLVGAVSTAFGVLVLLNVVEASAGLLGLILGVQTLAEGIGIMLVGRETLAVNREARSTRKAMLS
jgi:membrane protein HdeD